MVDINEFLAQKGAEYAPFNPNRAPFILSKITKSLKYFKEYPPKVIEIIGTNGKGSTGRFLALMLREAGFSVGHFTSPHIQQFSERFWLDGEVVSISCLQEALNTLLLSTDLKEASYFELLTFLALEVFKKCDYLVLEAGLGGEFDSTFTCTNPVLALFSNISFDHEEFLGESIEQIATTKLQVMQKIKKAILGFQNFTEVEKTAKEISKKYNSELFLLREMQFSKEVLQSLESYLEKYHLFSFQKDNALLAYVGARKLGVEVDFNTLPRLDLMGRMQAIAPNFFINVGHNQSAALSLRDIVSKNYPHVKIILVFNAFLDKKPKKVLEILSPIVSKIYILPISDNERITPIDTLTDVIENLKIPYQILSKKELPFLQEQAKDGNLVVVFGSFSVVERFLRDFWDLKNFNKL